MTTKVYSLYSFVVDDDGEHTEDTIPLEFWYSEGGGPGEGPGWYCGNPSDGSYSFAGNTKAEAMAFAIAKLDEGDKNEG